MTLASYISSDYVAAANRLSGNNQKERIVVYVESYDDIFFWRSVLCRFENEQRHFEVMLPTRKKKLERGKKAAIMAAVAGKTGRHMIACVDADYDYLLQRATDSSRQLLDSSGIFHTYAYAIENMQCYAPSLHTLCVSATLNDYPLFNFEAFLRDYSRIIHPLFVWSVWAYASNNYHAFTLTDFCNNADIPKFALSETSNVLTNLAERVERRIKKLREAFPKNEESIEKLNNRLQTLGVTPENTYLYIQGHHLFNRVVLPLLKRVSSQLVHHRQREITIQSRHSQQRANELSCYARSLTDVEQALKKNTGYTASPEFQRILQDLKQYLL